MLVWSSTWSQACVKAVRELLVPVASQEAAMGIEELLTAPRAAWQNAFVERFIGSARRECFDHVIVFNEAGIRPLARFWAEPPIGLLDTTRHTWSVIVRMPAAGGPVAPAA